MIDPAKIKIVGIAGRIGSGKKTAARYLELRGWSRFALADPIKLLVAHEAGGELLKRLPARELWQQLGTECGREAVDPQLWVKLLAARIILANRVAGVDRVVVSDVRFPDEADAIHVWGGKVIRIERTVCEAARTARLHASEEAVARIAADVTIRKDGTLQQLCGEMAAALRNLGIAEDAR